MAQILFSKKNYNPSVYNDWREFLNSYGVFEGKKGDLDQAKYEFLAEMAHNQATIENREGNKIFESVAPGLLFQRPGSISNMGPAVAPTPTQTPFFNGAKTTIANSGSGDKFPSLLPVSIQAAAKTIAFDLFATINMDAPVGFIPYLDYVYMGGDIDSKYPAYMFRCTKIDAETPIEGGSGSGSDVKTFGDVVKNGDTLTTDGGLELKFVGYTRVDGGAVFRVISMDSTNLKAGFSGALTLTGSSSGSEDDQVILTLDESNSEIQLTSALENHISGFTTEDEENDWQGNYYAKDADGNVKKFPNGMPREVSEKAKWRQMGVKMFTKFVQAEADQIALSATIEEIQDMNKLYNYDVISMLEQIGVNEIAQQISKKLVERGYQLGALHNKEIAKVEGQGITTLSLETAGAFENTTTLQRKVVTKVAEMSNLIYHRSRWGAGEYIVTNGRVAAALADVNGYTISPFNAKMPQTGGQLYPIGQVYGMNVYVDPNMTWGDNRMLIGRKGTDEEPGIKFMPYIMAETIQTISESTMSPKLGIKSRYAITEAGWHPETQYVLLTIDGVEKLTASAGAGK